MDLPQRLRVELEQATAELKAHMASWEYAFAMGGGRNHPVHQQTRARTEELRRDTRTSIAASPRSSCWTRTAWSRP